MSRTVSNKEARWALRWAVIIVGLSCLPYLLAWQLAPPDGRYTGLLINHLDGESYYAKMQQGARGEWLFHLPYTPEPHQGAFVYTFYLALGHLATGLGPPSVTGGLPIPWVYHMARAAGGLFLLLVAYRFIARFFEQVPARRAAFLLLGFSAGLGWLVAPLGIISADLWVAEAFTFLSILVNPHFPLGTGLMLLIFVLILDLRREGGGDLRRTAVRLAGAAAASLGLSLIHPMALPVALAVLGVYFLALAARERRLPRREALAIAAVVATAVPMLLYILLTLTTNPAMAAWSRQNQTTSLPPWEYALGYGLILLLALGGSLVAARRRTPTDLFLLSWVGSVAILLYLPFAFQRRFSNGLHVPLVLLATIGLERLIWPWLRARRRAPGGIALFTGLLVGASALTNLFVLLVAVAGVARGGPPLLMSADQAAACDWLGHHSAWTDTVLAPTDVSHLVPAFAGNRVVYGHPFETIDAEDKKSEVDRFFGGKASASERQALLARYGVRYLLHIPAADPDLPGLAEVWRGQDAVLYRVIAEPTLGAGSP